MVSNKAQRVPKEMIEIVNYIKAKYLLMGKTPPTTAKIMKQIAKKINKEDLLRNEFIKF